jgi:hypothetical protein
MAVAILIAQGKLPRPERVIMSNTTREASEVWKYTAEFVIPLFDHLGLRLEIVTADGSLYEKGSHLPRIPAYTGGGQLPVFCSNYWKRDLIRRYLRQLGYGPDHPILQWIGLSLDEVGRMKSTGRKWIKNHWPLILDARMRRGECIQLVLNYGWPSPPRSACWMCPFRRNVEWLHLFKHWPDDWNNAVALDEEIRRRDRKHSLFVHHQAVPLSQADLESPQLGLPFDGCDSGHCWV